ncbi:MAG: 4Fe-4S ferredoxin, partial [Candidatus Omnitrophica bacterium]|nr:4Fe-4S ferredoxin [Candidatus Omnitrophota bacterium]
LEEEVEMKHNVRSLSGCPGSKIMDFRKEGKGEIGDTKGKRPSELRQWPIQLHLVSPQAAYYEKADVLLSADCVAYAIGDFHKDFLKGKSLAIACPKLDESQEAYVEKIKSLIEDAKINTLTVMIMQVPCCYGLVALAQEAAKQTKRKIPIKSIVVGLQGEVLSEEWL